MFNNDKVSSTEVLEKIIQFRWFLLVALLVLHIIVSGPNQDFFTGGNATSYLLFGIFFLLNLAFYLRVRLKRHAPKHTFPVIKVSQLLFDPILFTALFIFSSGVETHTQCLYLISILIAATFFRQIVVVAEIAYCSLLYLGVIFFKHFTHAPLHSQVGLEHFVEQNHVEVYLDALHVVVLLWLGGILAVMIVKLVNNREKQSIKAQEQSDSIVETLIDGLVVYDENHYIIKINKQAEQILGIKKKELEGVLLSDLKVKPKYKQIFNMALKSSRTGKPSLTKKITLKQKTKSITIQTNVLLVLNRKNKYLGMVQILRDISREKAIDTMKSEFISVAAHQLRTPLSIIKWTLQMIIRGDFGKIPQQSKKQLETTYSTNERIISLVNDLLDVSNIEEGKFGYKFELEKLEQVIAPIIKTLQNSPLCRTKKITLKFIKPKQKIPMVKIDRARFGMAVQNVLDNAIKYSHLPRSQITVRIELKKKAVEICIEDQGVGIPKSDRKKIFTKFARGSNVAAMQTAGSGLGLFITNNIIRAHGGSVSYRSKEGEGTKFIFTLPLVKYFVVKKPKNEYDKFLQGF